MPFKFFILCIFLVPVHICYTQNGLPSTYGARGIAMGGTGVTFKDANALLNNQAGLARIRSFTAIIAAEQRFAIEDLQSVAAGVAFPGKGGTFGLILQYFGFDLYNEQRLGLAYSRQLLENFSIGAQFVLHNTQIEEYGNKLAIAAEVGLLYDITEALSVGVHIFNPIRTQVIEGEYLPTVFRFGLGYQSSEKALFLAEVTKDIDYPVQIRIGIEYLLMSQLHLRTGIATKPEKWNFGIGYWLKQQNLKVDISASHHQYLGFTPGISLSFQSE